jgi:hypothetical protein
MPPRLPRRSRPAIRRSRMSDERRSGRADLAGRRPKLIAALHGAGPAPTASSTSKRSRAITAPARDGPRPSRVCSPSCSWTRVPNPRDPALAPHAPASPALTEAADRPCAPERIAALEASGCHRTSARAPLHPDGPEGRRCRSVAGDGFAEIGTERVHALPELLLALTR